ncbi:MAG: DUF2059 domain-containing protein [Cypionkella sp.]|jgi:hypothetical protein|nr:DUF2059 domain-containing protein [Cypionkella sp.]
MTPRPLLFALCLALAPFPGLAETPAPQTEAQVLVQAETGDAAVIALSETMRIGEIIDIMREEGLAYGQTLEAEMFPGGGGPRWQGIVGMIYDGEKMRARFDAAFARELANAPEDVGQIAAFFAAEPGARFLTLELEARRALLDESVEDAAKLAWEDMVAAGDPRVDLLRRFAETNDLIESNVMGALNANLAFYRGMAEAGAFGDDMTEDQMLADVWGQEADVRAETEDWLFPFLALAYQPLTDEELDTYIVFSETPAGQRMNAALFAAFDEVFTAISQDLGRAVAIQLQGQDI